MLIRPTGPSVRRRMLDRCLESLRHRLSGAVLEVGAGTMGRRGTFRPPAASEAIWLYLDLARRRQPHIVGDLQRLPLRSQTFDAALCLEVLEYVLTPSQGLSELGRVLKPGGTLVLSTPFLHRADTPTDRWRLTQHGLETLLGEAGFTVEAVYQQGAALAVAANILQFSVGSVRSRLWRWPLAGLALGPTNALLALDAPTMRRLPVLQSFSTGFVAVAVKPGPGAAGG